MPSWEKHAVTTADVTVFVVESHVTVGDSMRALLESAGLNVEVFRSGQQFTDAFDLRWSGCLVLDLDPSSASTFDFLDNLSARGIALPVILITWSNDAAMRNRAKRAGVAAMLEKPLSDAVLLDAIKRAFGQD